MSLNPLQLLGAFVIACILLALARFDERRASNEPMWRYSLRTLLIVMTAAAIAFGAISIALRLELFSVRQLPDIAVLVMLNMVAALTVLFARRLNREQ